LHGCSACKLAFKGAGNPCGAICANCEPRLIIITNDEEVVLRCCEDADEP
jgi:hypothetical protein